MALRVLRAELLALAIVGRDAAGLGWKLTHADRGAFLGVISGDTHAAAAALTTVLVVVALHVAMLEHADQAPLALGIERAVLGVVGSGDLFFTAVAALHGRSEREPCQSHLSY
jgi:hypothetical protein